MNTNFLQSNGITLGSDPELFLVNNTTGKVVSSIGVIPGLKGDAYRPEGFEKGFGLQIDNVLAEFNIPPVQTRDAWVGHMLKMKEYIDSYVKGKLGANHGVMCIASALVDEDQLQSDEAKEFGCMPDFNAYTEDVNPKPEGESTNLRTTGFHVHVGYEFDNADEKILMIKLMDAFLGLPSILLDPDDRRRELYGKAGCFRMTDYGFEYRTLSGFFLSNETLIGWVFDQTVEAIKAFKMGIKIDFFLEIKDAIDNNDKDAAEKLYNRVKNLISA